MGVAGLTVPPSTIESNLQRKSTTMMRLGMHPRKQAPCRMDPKIYFTSFIYFLFVIKASWAEDPSPAPNTPSAFTPAKVQTTTHNMQLATLTGKRVESNVTRDVDSSTKPLPTKQRPNQHITVSPASGSVTSAPKTKAIKDTSSVTWTSDGEDAFTYDYESLRIAGLIFAGVFFVLGILVLTCGNIRKMPKCHKKSSKSYRVVQG
uniref:FXYD domain-containing ion transport regulator n=1 Tax=Nothobranchius kadleci TaxID=1051664 RepID=A0A1A8DYK4_NOTKA|nr:FXYD domain containing ion transport regulator 5 isoform X1 [Nothobranchius furzeri]